MWENPNLLKSLKLAQTYQIHTTFCKYDTTRGSDGTQGDKKREIATTGADDVVSIVNVIVQQTTKRCKVWQSRITPAESQTAGKKLPCTHAHADTCHWEKSAMMNTTLQRKWTLRGTTAPEIRGGIHDIIHEEGMEGWYYRQKNEREVWSKQDAKGEKRETEENTERKGMKRLSSSSAFWLPPGSVGVGRRSGRMRWSEGGWELMFSTATWKSRGCFSFGVKVKL
jgi:hypothetical protein